MLASNTWYKSIAILRLLCIPLFFLFDHLYIASIPKTNAFSNVDIKIDFEFSAFEFFWMWLLTITVPLFALLHVLFSFKIKLLERNRVRRIVLAIEAIMIPFLIYISWNKIDDVFIPHKDYGIIGEYLSKIFPRRSVNIYEQLQAITVALYTLLTIFCFIKVARSEIRLRLEKKKITIPNPS